MLIRKNLRGFRKDSTRIQAKPRKVDFQETGF